MNTKDYSASDRPALVLTEKGREAVTNVKYAPRSYILTEKGRAAAQKEDAK